MSDMAVHYASTHYEWGTPRALFDPLHAEFNFTLDAAAAAENAKCPKYFSRADDGLAQDWSGERVWLNPPYGRHIGLWMRKAYEEAGRGALVVMLVPSRTDTAWFHDYALKGEVRFLRGRSRFEIEGGAQGNAPFPCCLVIFRARDLQPDLLTPMSA